MRVQGLYPTGGARPVRDAAGEEHRLRRRGHLSGPPARLSDRGRADPLGGSARFSHARKSRLGHARGMGPLPDPSHSSADPPARHPTDLMDVGRLRRLGRAGLPTVAIVVFAMTTVAVLATAGGTLGDDYQAYVGAAQRAVEGAPLYDTAGGRRGGGGGGAAREGGLAAARRGGRRGGRLRFLLVPADVRAGLRPVRGPARRRRVVALGGAGSRLLRRRRGDLAGPSGGPMGHPA